MLWDVDTPNSLMSTADFYTNWIELTLKNDPDAQNKNSFSKTINEHFWRYGHDDIIRASHIRKEPDHSKSNMDRFPIMSLSLSQLPLRPHPNNHLSDKKGKVCFLKTDGLTCADTHAAGPAATTRNSRLQDMQQKSDSWARTWLDHNFFCSSVSVLQEETRLVCRKKVLMLSCIFMICYLNKQINKCVNLLFNI